MPLTVFLWVAGCANALCWALRASVRCVSLTVWDWTLLCVQYMGGCFCIILLLLLGPWHLSVSPVGPYIGKNQEIRHISGHRGYNLIYSSSKIRYDLIDPNSKTEKNKTGRSIQEWTWNIRELAIYSTCSVHAYYLHIYDVVTNCCTATWYWDF